MLSFAGMPNPVSVDLRSDGWSGFVRIMPLGDSITSTNGSYRETLWWKLNQAGYTADFVGSYQDIARPDPDHQGTPGQTAHDLVPLVPDLMARYSPSVVLLL